MNRCVCVVCVRLFLCSTPQKCPIFWWGGSSQDDPFFSKTCTCVLVTFACIYIFNSGACCKNVRLLLVCVLWSWPMCRQEMNVWTVVYDKWLCAVYYKDAPYFDGAYPSVIDVHFSYIGEFVHFDVYLLAIFFQNLPGFIATFLHCMTDFFKTYTSMCFSCAC